MKGGKYAKKEPRRIRSLLNKWKLPKPKDEAAQTQASAPDPAPVAEKPSAAPEGTAPEKTPPEAVSEQVKPTDPPKPNPAAETAAPVQPRATPAESAAPAPENLSAPKPEPRAEKAKKADSAEKPGAAPEPEKAGTAPPNAAAPAKSESAPKGAEAPKQTKNPKQAEKKPEDRAAEQRQRAEQAAEKKKQAARKKADKQKKKAEKKQAKAVKQAEKKPKRLEQMDPAKVSRAAYQIGIAFLVVVIGLSLWLGRETYTVASLQSWFQLQFVGTGRGDGFPVEIKGHTVDQNNFTHVGSHAAVLSNTALTVYNQSGKEQYTVRHSFEHPAMRHIGDQFILYDIGGKNFMVQNSAKTVAEVQLTDNIYSAAISSSGVYALATAKDGYASWLDVYASDGTKKYTYSFFAQYVTSVAINSEGTQGVVSAITSESGTVQSIITVLDFNQEAPLYQHQFDGNMLLDVHWGENNVIYAVGDDAFLWSAGGKSFQEYSYSGQYLTAYQLEGSRAMIAISAHEYAGESTLLSFYGTGDPLAIDVPAHVTSISSFGGMVGALYGETIGFYDNSTGVLMAESHGNIDIKGIALSNERSAYTLAISEVRYIAAETVPK